MPEANDMDRLREFAQTGSETAFAELVRRHLGLVYSVALRHVGSAAPAEEITQAVFIILARQAARLRPGTVLAGWLHTTARLTALSFLRGERRRQFREQEAYMQSIPPDSNDAGHDADWQQLAPLLDEAIARLGQKDRDALLLRFFKNQSIREVADALGMNEPAAQRRILRALEKLRKAFASRGVHSSAAAIAGCVSANSIQIAPAALAQAATAVALAKGAAASASTLTLIKGALKIMAWTKMKIAVATVCVAAFAIGVTTSTIVFASKNSSQQRLKDGSILSISQISFGDTHDIVTGDKTNHWSWPGHEMLIVEFRLSGKRAADNPLVKPPFYRTARCMLYGEKGIEYAQEISPSGFKRAGPNFFGDFQTAIVPRDSKFLWLRIEESPTNRPYGSWKAVAEFKIRNPAPLEKQNWIAGATPMTNSATGMSFVLNGVILKTNANDARDIWNHKVSIETEAWTNGIRLTNWAPIYIEASDASGNSVGYFQTHRSLDPDYVWKLDMDFEPISDFAETGLETIAFPEPATTTVTNILGVPVTITWDGRYLDAQIPTNRADVAVKFIKALDDQGRNMEAGGASWGKYGFREGSFSSWIGKNSLTSIDVKPATLTFAIVPNVHTTFYIQPQLIRE